MSIDLATTARIMHEEFLGAHFRTTSIPKSITTWVPPNSQLLKLNVDAAYSSGTKKASLGMLVRDRLGSVHLCAMTS